MAPTVEQFIAACRAEVGTREQPAGSNRTEFAKDAGHANGYAWCHTFLVAMAERTGLDLPDGVERTAYTPTGANAWKAAGRWGTTPRVGAWAYADFPGDNVRRISHVFLVTSIRPDGRLGTIEGNTSIGSKGSQRDGMWVAEKVRDRSIVKGYGYPDYTVPAPLPAPVVIVKRGSVEEKLLALYPHLFPWTKGVRLVDPDPSKDIYAAANPSDVAFGVGIWGAQHQFLGKDRYETLKLAVKR